MYIYKNVITDHLDSDGDRVSVVSNSGSIRSALVTEIEEEIVDEEPAFCFPTKNLNDENQGSTAVTGQGKPTHDSPKKQEFTEENEDQSEANLK